MTMICWLSVPLSEVLGGQPACGLSHTYIPSTRTAPACGGAQCVKEGGGEGAGQTRGPFHQLSLSSANKAQVGKHTERTWKVAWGESLTMKKISKWKKTWRSILPYLVSAYAWKRQTRREGSLRSQGLRSPTPSPTTSPSQATFPPK